jgi:hypothetical protein
VLFDGVHPETSRKIGPACAVCGNEQSQGRQAMIGASYDHGQPASFADQSFGSSDLPLQFGFQQTYNAANPAAIAPTCLGMSEAEPWIDKRGAESLRRNVQLGIQRDARVLVVSLPQDRRGRSPDTGSGTSSIPLTAPQREGLFNPYSKAINAFLRWQHSV